jgi:2-phosphoglycerate kinase
MKQPTIIFITGLPATGKTTIGNEIRQKLEIPFFSKDIIKELLFDSLGFSDREWSKKIGQAAYLILDNIIKEELMAGRTFILESNFKPQFDNQKFRDWQKQYNFKSIQIICSTEPKILFERFKQRTENGQRHPGHRDMDNLDEWEKILSSQKSEPLDIKGRIIDIDTTDFKLVNKQEIIEEIKAELSNLL